MPEGNTTIKTNGSWVGDTMDEWKKLPTWGKIAVAGVLVVVAYLAWRARSASSSAQKAAASTASTDPLGSAGAATTGSQSPFPMVGNLPVLPSGVNPIFDSAGNPIAYQQQPPASQTNPPTPKPINTPTPTPTKPVAFPGGTPGGPPVQKATPPTTHMLMANPIIYHQASTPHVSSAVPQRAPSPAPARVAAQRNDVQQLRTEQAAATNQTQKRLININR